MSDEQAHEAFYRLHRNHVGEDGDVLFPGVAELLDEIDENVKLKAVLDDAQEECAVLRRVRAGLLEDCRRQGAQLKEAEEEIERLRGYVKGSPPMAADAEAAHLRRQMGLFAELCDNLRDTVHEGIELRAALDDELKLEHRRRTMVEADCAKFLDQRDDLEKQLRQADIALSVKAERIPSAELAEVIDKLIGERDNLLAEREELWEGREKAQKMQTRLGANQRRHILEKADLRVALKKILDEANMEAHYADIKRIAARALETGRC